MPGAPGVPWSARRSVGTRGRVRRESASRQLLALLTPAERTVAVTLLGYPEKSVGRLMTPHYVAVREQWTISEVLDYVRSHGQDSETLNVIYVVDETGRKTVGNIVVNEFVQGRHR